MVEVPESAHHWLNEIKNVAGLDSRRLLALARAARLNHATIASVLDFPSVNCSAQLVWALAAAAGVQNGCFPTLGHFRSTVDALSRRQRSVRLFATQLALPRSSVSAFLRGRCPRCSFVVVAATALSLDVRPRRITGTGSSSQSVGGSILDDINYYSR